MKHMTSSWLRRYANLNKMASYHDKLAAVYEEKNPYYLLEWLLFTPSTEEAEHIRFKRTPSMEVNSYLDFTDVFFNQIVYHIAFKAHSTSQRHTWILYTAIDDLREHYGHDAWVNAVHSWDESLQIVWTQLALFQQQMALEQQQLTTKYRHQIKELRLSLHEQSEELQYKLLNAKEMYEQKLQDVPRNLLKKDYKAWPLIAYVHYNKLEESHTALQRLKEHFLATEDHTILGYIHHDDFPSLWEKVQSDEDFYKQLINWYPAYAAKTLMTIEYVNTTQRQMWWLSFLNYLSEHDLTDQNSVRLWDVTYELSGISETMMEAGEVPPYFHQLIAQALQRNKRIKWIREVILLRHWDVFITAFAREDYSYEALSWVLCLDPDSLEERLIRGFQRMAGKAVGQTDLVSIIKRISDVFIDAIRSGIRAEKMGPLFNHLTIHHIDFIYSYVHSIKKADEFFPLLQMEPSLLQRIFGGTGIRAKEARRAMQPIFLAWFEHLEHSEDNKMRLLRWGTIFYTDKGELLQRWLDQLEQEEGIWPEKEAALLAELFQIEWLGKPSASDAAHELVSEWLVKQSDWIQFDLDTPFSRQDGVTYRILRPGYQDVLAGKILARVTVRAEMTDRNKINSLLDDLMDI